jgi:tRNA nucleotidyltransferase (CCA-adding enzyme)
MSCDDVRAPLEEEVLSKLRPSKVQLRTLSNLYELLKSRLASYLGSEGLSFIVEPEGSFAKGTLLSDHWELDVFVLFKDVDEAWIKAKAREELERALEGLPLLIKYSEHPYVTVSLMGLEADVVPVRYLERPTRNMMGVSRTPFHTSYVRSRLNDCMADDVRLLKSLFKGIGAYGAEAHVGGFSGYLSELLIITYGSFHKAIEAISKWKPPVFIDPESVGDRRDLEERYCNTPLIVVDPVDPARNAAAAVTAEKLNLAITAAKLYLRRPRREFFHMFSRYVTLGVGVPAALLLCRGDYSNSPPGDVWGRLARASKSLSSIMAGYGFNVLRTSFYTDEHSVAAVGLLLDTLRLPAIEAVRGPQPYVSSEQIESFASSRSSEGLWFEEGLIGVRRRKIDSAQRALTEAAEQAPLPEGTSGCEVIVFDDVRDAAKISWVLRDWISRELASTPAWLLQG